MDGWFLRFDVFLLTVSAALPEARGPEERRYFWEKQEVFGCQVTIFLTASV